MNKIIRENYPVAKLPDDLRNGAEAGDTVTITVAFEKRPDKVRTLEEIFSSRRPPYRTKREIDAEIHRQRDEWDD